jgi:hypothetical protein
MKENLIAIIKDGVVDSIVVGSDEWAASLEEETVNVTDLPIGIGWNYSNAKFVSPEGRSIEEHESHLKFLSEKFWRNAELESTDFIVPLTDHPKHSAYMTYRQELRDYPSQPDFSNGTRPLKP